SSTSTAWSCAAPCAWRRAAACTRCPRAARSTSRAAPGSATRRPRAPSTSRCACPRSRRARCTGTASERVRLLASVALGALVGCPPPTARERGARGDAPPGPPASADAGAGPYLALDGRRPLPPAGAPIPRHLVAEVPLNELLPRLREAWAPGQSDERRLWR